jgi:hypothetical protein
MIITRKAHLKTCSLQTREDDRPKRVFLTSLNLSLQTRELYTIALF